MKKNIIVIILSLFSITLMAQKFQWARQTGADDAQFGNSNTVDRKGNVYTTGYFKGKVDFDPGPGVFNLTATSNADVFLSVLDANGAFVMARRFGSTYLYDPTFGQCVTVDTSGNIYLTGFFNGTVDFNSGPDTFNLVTGGYEDVFILKLNPQGNLAWAKRIGSYGYDIGFSICVDPFGNVFTTGKFAGTVDFDPGLGVYNLTSAGSNDIFVSKLDSSGSFKWARTMGGASSDFGKSIKTDAMGNVYVNGDFNGTADFDPGTGTFFLTSNGSIDFFIVKLNASGNFVWAKSIGGSNAEYTKSIALDSSANIYTIGIFFGTVDFDPGTGTSSQTSIGHLDVFALKLDSSGNYKWAKTFGGVNADDGSCLDVSPGGHIYLAGVFSDKADFDPGAATFDMAAINGDAYVSCLDNAGNFLWAKQFGSTNRTQVSSIILDSMENSYLTGGFQLTTNFDPGPGTYYLTVASPLGDRDVFNLKLGPCSTLNPAGLMNGPATVCVASSTSYSIASVTGATGYLWLVPPGAVINSGQNTTSINVTFGASSGNISVMPLNACGGSLSNTRVQAIAISPIINTVPVAPLICSGGSVPIKVTGANTYSWYPATGLNATSGDSVIASPAVTTTYTITGTVVPGCSNIKTITVIVKPKSPIIKQPSNQLVSLGSDVFFVVKSSNPNAIYGWQQNTGTGFVNLQNTTKITGVYKDTLKIKGVTISQRNYKYRCMIIDSFCSYYSDTASLKINCLFSVLNQVQNQTAKIDSDAVFTLTTTNKSLGYQWQEDAGTGFINLSNSGKYSGVTKDSLWIISVKASDNNKRFRCVITDVGCTDTSAIGILNIYKTGIPDHMSENAFTIYPNPANTNLTLTLVTYAENEKLISNCSIYNLLGQKIMDFSLKEKISELNISMLSRGIYLIKAGNDVKMLVKN